MKRGIPLVILCALLFAGLASVVSAGGWAVVTLDAVPTNVVVEQPIQVGMTIRQHGQTPWVFDNVRVRGYHSTGETFVVRVSMDERGHYTANLNFNKAGKWQWAVASGLMPEWQTMPDIEVANSVQDEVLLAEANAANKPATPSFESMLPSLTLLALGVLGAAGCGGGLIFWLRSRK
jgi:hypothetical protein